MFPAATAAPFARNVVRRVILAIFSLYSSFARSCQVFSRSITVSVTGRGGGGGGDESRRLQARRTTFWLAVYREDLQAAPAPLLVVVVVVVVVQNRRRGKGCVWGGGGELRTSWLIRWHSLAFFLSKLGLLSPYCRCSNVSSIVQTRMKLPCRARFCL